MQPEAMEDDDDSSFTAAMKRDVEFSFTTYAQLEKEVDEGQKVWDEKIAVEARLAAENSQLKRTKEETSSEMFHRIQAKKQAQDIKRHKKVAKGLIKKKQMQKLTTFFPKK
jgi:phosphoribosyl-ATP pyrophosphohydrolase